MAERTAAPRGSYAKGIAKREEILQSALEVIAREGYRGASVKVIADSVGLSQAGLLHYFDSKEELFVEILRKRDAVDVATYSHEATDSGAGDIRDGFIEVMKHNAEVPGLVQLYARLSVEATDASHPAHDYFLARSRGLREGVADAAADNPTLDGVTQHLDPETFARILQAVADGLQLQWLLEPDIDMADIIEQLLGALASAGSKNS